MRQVFSTVGLLAAFFIFTGGYTGQNHVGVTASDSGTTGEIVAAEKSDSVKGGTQKLVKADFLKLIWNYETTPNEWKFLGDKPALIDFYADWCGPCRIASPLLEEISHEFAGKVNIYKIDTDREKELAAVFGVRGIPVFLYIPKEGRPVMMVGIARSKEDTKKMFIENINKYLLMK
ncbi:MAG: thioredoxin domain-containing protein [Prolixibacteraceae bacterium]|nr:thioredoxin domain-containing protein [Prolixibacteraceae bacterium]